MRLFKWYVVWFLVVGLSLGVVVGVTAQSGSDDRLIIAEFEEPDTLDPELFLPDPEPATVDCTIISVVDHVVEPPHVFEEYMTPRLRSRGPQLVETDDGHQVWRFEGADYTQVGMNAVAGRRPETVRVVVEHPADVDESVTVGVRQRPEKDAVDHTEYSGRGTDTESQSE